MCFFVLRTLYTITHYTVAAVTLVRIPVTLYSLRTHTCTPYSYRTSSVHQCTHNLTALNLSSSTHGVQQQLLRYSALRSTRRSRSVYPSLKPMLTRVFVLTAGLFTACQWCVHGVVGFPADWFMLRMSADFMTLMSLHATMLFVSASASCCLLVHHSSPILFSFCASPRACSSTSSCFSLI